MLECIDVMKHFESCSICRAALLSANANGILEHLSKGTAPTTAPQQRLSRSKAIFTSFISNARQQMIRSHADSSTIFGNMTHR